MESSTLLQIMLTARGSRFGLGALGLAFAAIGHDSLNLSDCFPELIVVSKEMQNLFCC